LRSILEKTKSYGKFEESICACKTCVSMCKTNPCWPTPNEVRELIKAGYGDRLMIDWWEDYPEDIHLFCPASENFEKSRAPEAQDSIEYFAGWTKGRCTFLSKDNKCELHDKGLKPLEGRVATHKTENNKESERVRNYIVHLWKGEQENFIFEVPSGEKDWPVLVERKTKSLA